MMEIACPESGNVLSKSENNLLKDGSKLHEKYTDPSLTPGQGSMRIALSCHNILNIIVEMTVSCIRDSDALISVPRTYTA
jgi:hypothetical protein